MGEIYYELGEEELAKRYLFEAYMLEGTDIYEDEDEKYLDVIKNLCDEDNI